MKGLDNKMIQKDNKRKQEYKSEGIKLYEMGEYEEAIIYLKRELEKRRDTAIDVLFTLGKCYEEVGFYEKAQEYYEKILKIKSSNEEAQIEIGKIYLKLDNVKKAKAIFQKILEKDCDNIEAKWGLGKIFMRLGDRKKARQIFEEIIKEDRAYAPARMELVKILRKKEPYSAMEQLEKVIKLKGKESVEAYLELGKLYMKEGYRLQAEEALLNFVKKDVGNYIEGYEILANLYKIKGEDDKAQRVIERMEEIKQNKEEIKNRIKQADELEKKNKVVQKKDSKISFSYDDLLCQYFEEAEFDNVEFEILKPKTTQQERAGINGDFIENLQLYPKDLSAQSRYQFFSKLQPDKKFKGKEKFAGYLIFEYQERGICVLEKFFEKDVEKSKRQGRTILKESEGNASYVFPRDISFQLAKLSKTEIIEIMKTQEEIQRQIHRGGYYSNMLSKMSRAEQLVKEKAENPTEIKKNGEER